MTDPSGPFADDRWGLRTLMTRTLDPGYAAAARRGTPRRRSTLILALVVVLLAGVVIGVSFRQRERQATDRQAANDALIAQIDQRQDQVGALQADSLKLRGQIAQLRESALSSTSDGKALLDKLHAQELASGLSAVTGPGIVITIGDPKPDAGNDPVGHGQTAQSEALVTDTDLQTAVNALWACGAEAIAVNGVRIGPVTAIRQAGGALLIDFQPAASPYVIEVIGNPATMPASFAATSSARRFSTYRTAYGAEYSVHTAEKLALAPAAEPIAAGTTETTEGG